MKPDRDVEEVEEAHVEAQREGQSSDAGASPCVATLAR